jgi:chaperone modulatory protein CbpM
MTTIDRVLEGQMLDETAWLQVAEFCAHLQVEPSRVAELVEVGVLEPRGTSPEAWSFPVSALSRARTVVRLVDDLGVNPAGAALILELLEERRVLERRLGLLERLLED